MTWVCVCVCLDLVEGLAALLPKQEHTSSTKVFPLARCGCRLADAIKCMVDHCFDGGEVNLGAAGNASSIKQAQVIVEQAKNELNVDKDTKVVEVMATQIENLVKDGMDKLDSIGQAMARGAMTELQGITNKLKDIGRGVKGGKDWLEGVTEAMKNNWKKLNAKAQDTLCKETEVAGLRLVIDNVDKVVWPARCQILWGGFRDSK